VFGEVPNSPPEKWRFAVEPVVIDGAVLDWRENPSGIVIAAHAGNLEPGDLDAWFATFSYRRWVGEPEMIVDLTRVAAAQGEVLLCLRRATTPGGRVRDAMLGTLLGEIEVARRVVSQDKAGALAIIDRQTKRVLSAVPANLTRTLTSGTQLRATDTSLFVVLAAEQIDAASFQRADEGLDIIDRTGSSHHLKGKDVHLGGILAGSMSANVEHTTLAAVYDETLTTLEDLANAALNAKAPLRFLPPSDSDILHADF
jgi:hypothetical protein